MIDIEKLRSKPVQRLTFPSRTKAKKFVNKLFEAGFTDSNPNYVYNNAGKPNTYLMIFKDSLSVLDIDQEVLVQGSLENHYEYLIEEEPVKIHKDFAPFPCLRHNTHYITKDILNSDLALRYYIQFDDRKTYERRWYIKCKATKKYMSITEEQAVFINKTMCNAELPFNRVLGFKVQGGFKKLTIIDNQSVLWEVKGKNAKLSN